MAFANDYQKRQPSVCLQCRQIFPSNNQLHRHIKNDCWATESEHQYPEEWTPDLKDYVRRALDPANSEPGWASSEIVEELKQMIYFGHILDPAIGPRWKTMKLPQHIDPADLPYDRKPRHRIQESPVPSPPSTPLPTKTYPELFHAPHSTPQSLFKHKDGAHFVAHRDYREVLLFADGACTNNGQEGAQGGCAFVTHCSDSRPTPWHPPKGAYFMHGMFFFRLEDVGPTGKAWRPTSNRAELRAVVAALHYFRMGHHDLDFWKPKECATLVIATDSAYVVNGATSWAKKWESNGWVSSTGEDVKNQDLWEELLKGVRWLQSERCQKVSLWHIPREQNMLADRGAKYAATLKARPTFGVPRPDALPILVDASQLG